MENELAELYNALAKKLNSMIPTDWIELYYLGEVEKGRLSLSSVFYFKDSARDCIIRSHDIPSYYATSEEVYDELLEELEDSLLELYDTFERNEQELWEQISFKLHDSGKFEVDYFYDVMNDNDGGQSNREVVWAYETFGFIPKEGSYLRELLDEYLSEKPN